MSIVEVLQALLPAGAVLTGSEALQAYEMDWRGRYRGHAACAVLPATTAEVAAVVQACRQHGVPVVAQGGNTSLCEGAVPRAGGPGSVVVNLQRLRRVRSVDVANHSIEVEAGCVLAAVQQAAAQHGLLYPVSLGAEGSCQIGGNIATNAGGTGVLRWGNTRENVLGLEVVLPDGRVWDGLYRLRKNNTGLDLKHLFIGSEGTLGIVTAAVLRLHPLPTAQAVAWFATPSPSAAIELLGRFQQRCGGVLAAYEMMNDIELGHVLDHVPGHRAPVDRTHPWHVLVELSDSGPEAPLVDALEELLSAAGERGDVLDAVIAASGAQRAAFWAIRHGVSDGNKAAGMGINTDCAVPVSAVPAFIERATQAALAIEPEARIVIVAHLGDGNVHFIPMVSRERWQGYADADALSHRVKHAVNEVSHALGGTFSAEHGIGQVLTEEMHLFKPAVELELMRAVKSAIDPQDLFNPGRLLPAPTAPR
ncbi:MAG: FAD-binding oxidoreductase [Rubrivivax sp.]|jgi:FAD/FMN-containing dehydrogenase|nr:FAD-binding oxidoreductase [Rubrivivax sp.]